MAPCHGDLPWDVLKLSAIIFKEDYHCRKGRGVSKWLITLGIILLVLGVAWPWVIKLGLGSLPGDIRIERKGFVFYFPITTGIIVSLVVTLVLWIFRR